MQGIHKAFHSKAGQAALEVASQLAEMPAVKNSKYSKYVTKGLNGLNKIKQHATKQSGNENGGSRSLRHVGQRGRGLLLGPNSPLNGIPILGDIF